MLNLPIRCSGSGPYTLSETPKVARAGSPTQGLPLCLTLAPAWLIPFMFPTAYECSDNSHYELCSDSCPISCPSLSAPEGCESTCREGCVCNSGFVLSGGTCVPVGQCGCLYNDHYYLVNETFYPGPECERYCKCGPGGQVSCQEGKACRPYEECRVEDGVQACYPTGCGRCMVSGGIHYISLDGRVYDLHGSCSYVLAKVCQPDPEDDDFSIVLEKDEAGRPHRVLVTVADKVVSLAGGPKVGAQGLELGFCPPRGF